MTTSFAFGDRIRHAERPEWGVGTIVKAETVSNDGERGQRVTVRFSNAGMKTLSTQQAALERVTENGSNDHVDEDTPTVEMWDRLNESDWLGDHARRKINELMTELPMSTRDAFRHVRHRLRATIDLYRFDRSGRSLIDWAVAQSGLRDPLTRFTRSELEQLFDRWARERDEHLAGLIAEADDEQVVAELLADAPHAARKVVQRARAMQ